MIPNIQIEGDLDLHPEKPVHDAYELATGAIDPSSLPVSSQHVRVYDLMNEDQRTAYEKLYVDLANKAKAGKVIVTSNTRETLVRPDGSTGWFKYMEWTELDTSEILGA